MSTSRLMACAFSTNANARHCRASWLALALILAASPALAQSSTDCTPHKELRRLAQALLTTVTTPSEAEFRNALSAHTLPLPSVRVLFVPVKDGPRVEQFLNKFQHESLTGLYCETASDARGALVLAAPRLGNLEPINPQRPVIRGSLAPGLSQPSVVIAMPNYRFVRLGLTEAQLASGMPLELELETPARIQLLARDLDGPRPIALVSVPDAAADGPWRVSPPAPGPGASGLVSWLREQAGRPALRRNRLLQNAANLHACQVCKSGHITHVVAGDDPPARMRDQGLDARRVGEVVARGQDAGAAYAALLDSPSHLMTLLERDFTDVGVGLAHDERGRACLVVLLATFPRFVGRSSATVSKRGGQ